MEHLGTLLLRAALAGAALLLTAAPPVGARPAADGPPPGCAGTGPIRCHFDLAPGGYTVTARLGGDRSGATRVLAEARRVMTGPLPTRAGRTETVRFTVDVREPEGQPTGDGGTGTPGLDLVFDGPAPLLADLRVAPAPRVPHLFLVGDSTVCDQPTAPYTGWGQVLPRYFRAGLSVANHADSGEGSASFRSDPALLPRLAERIGRGDHVLIQLGHNDKATAAEEYRRNLTAIVDEVRAHGGVPVLVTPAVRRLFGPDGRLTPTALHVNGVGVDLPAQVRRVTAERDVALVDLTEAGRALLESLGPVESRRLFLTREVDGVNDNTHFSEYGAARMAELVVEGAREAGLDLVHHLRRPAP